MFISAVLLTKNEERNLPRVLNSLRWVDEVIVVDDQSTDRTVELARSVGAKVISNPLQDFSSQTNIGIAQAKGDWVLRMDADEEVPPEAIPQLQAAAQQAAADVGGFRILRKNIVLGQWVRHGQEYGKRVAFYDWARLRKGYRAGEYVGGAVKLFRRQGTTYVNAVHEEPVYSGKTIQLQTFVLHYTGETIQDIFNKVNLYTTMHAKQIYEQNPKCPPNHFYRLVLWHPLKTFLTLYFRKRGMLDGFPGFVRCFSSALYEHLKYLKTYDFYHVAAKTPWFAAATKPDEK